MEDKQVEVNPTKPDYQVKDQSIEIFLEKYLLKITQGPRPGMFLPRRMLFRKYPEIPVMPVAIDQNIAFIFTERSKVAEIVYTTTLVYRLFPVDDVSNEAVLINMSSIAVNKDSLGSEIPCF